MKVFYPIDKGDTPLETFHLDHLGPMTMTNKGYKHVFAVVDAFTKFCWLFATKTTNSKEVLQSLKCIQKTFGNPRRIITDKGTAFTSNDFQKFCTEENIKHVQVTTGVPRGNGQVERLNQMIIAVLTKFSLGNPDQWYKHVGKVQTAINSTFHRSTGTTPFMLLFGVEMRLPDDLRLKTLIEEEYIEYFQNFRDELRNTAKRKIMDVQREQKQTYNKKRKEAKQYSVGDLVAISRTQFATGKKIGRKFLGPYAITGIRGHNRYDVRRVGDHEGPYSTSTSADMVKPWITSADCDDRVSSGADDL